MRAFVLAGALTACIPNGNIGSTAWEITVDSLDRVEIGRGGHTAVLREAAIDMRAPDGSLAWTMTPLGPLVDVEVDPAGGLVALAPDTMTRLRPDGTVAWSQAVPISILPRNAIVLDRDDATWLLFTDDLGTHWRRYDRDGAQIGTGELPTGRNRALTPVTAALPDGGIAYVDGTGGVYALDASGPRWRIAPGAPGRDYLRLAVHDDGEITVMTDAGVIRLDAERHERWRRETRTHGRLGSMMASLTDGSVVTCGQDMLDDEDEISVLHRIDRDGNITTETVRDDVRARLAEGAPAALFGFTRRALDARYAALEVRRL